MALTLEDEIRVLLGADALSTHKPESQYEPATDRVAFADEVASAMFAESPAHGPTNLAEPDTDLGSFTVLLEPPAVNRLRRIARSQKQSIHQVARDFVRAGLARTRTK